MNKDQEALSAVMRLWKLGRPFLIRHYLYFSGEPEALSALKELRSRGFSSATRPSADGETFLVLVSHAFHPDRIRVPLLQQEVSAIARSFGGEYDGWEAEFEDWQPDEQGSRSPTAN